MAKKIFKKKIIAITSDASFVTLEATDIQSITLLSINGSENTPADSQLNLDGSGTVRVDVKNGDSVLTNYIF